MQKKFFTTKKLCFAAVLTALVVVFDLISIKIGNNIKITFDGLPIIIAAIYMGPVYGMTVGLLGSFIGQVISYGLTVTTILWIIPAGVRGLLVGLLFIAFKKSIKWHHLSIIIIISSLVVTILNTFVMYVDSIIFQYYTFAGVFGVTVFRVVSSILTAIVYILIISPIVKAAKNKVNL